MIVSPLSWYKPKPILLFPKMLSIIYMKIYIYIYKDVERLERERERDFFKTEIFRILRIVNKQKKVKLQDENRIIIR